MHTNFRAYFIGKESEKKDLFGYFFLIAAIDLGLVYTDQFRLWACEQ